MKKNFIICCGSQDSPHPKIYLTNKFHQTDTNKQDNSIQQLENIKCPYCGKEFK